MQVGVWLYRLAQSVLDLASVEFQWNFIFLCAKKYDKSAAKTYISFSLKSIFLELDYDNV